MTAPREFLLPDLGEGLTEAELLSWSVAEGDTVAVDQPLCEVETAKAVVELPAPYGGTVAALHARPGDTVPVGSPLITIETEDAAPGGDHPAPGGTARDGEARDGQGAAPPTLVGSGPLARHAPRRDWRQRSAPHLPPPPPPGAGPEPDGGPEPDAGPQPGGESRRPAKPAARKAARELGIDLDAVPPSRADGVVTADDVARAAAGDGSAAPDAGRPVRADAFRRATADAVARSARTLVHATAFRAVDLTDALGLLAPLRDDPHYADAHPTPLLLVAKAVLTALRRHPVLNAVWDDAGAVVERRHVDLGVAVAGPRGLTVPHVRSAETLGLGDLAAELHRLVEDARAGRSTTAELAPGTFSITNVGVFGLDAGTAIVNPGESAILSLGAVAPRPWVVDGALAVRTTATLGLSFDHRLIDGEQAGRFLADTAAALANPLLLAE